jgi:hypothetical protein
MRVCARCYRLHDDRDFDVRTEQLLEDLHRVLETRLKHRRCDPGQWDERK